MLTIEGVMMPGKGRMTVTGNLKDVMKESISAAASYVRSRAIDFGIEPPLFERRDIHVHVPEGATPKDGPSAGIAMATAIVSVLTGIPVRRDIAMTGEVTLRGRVLPIGGLKEKLLAALRGGIKTVLIPEENAKDLAEMPDSVKNGLEIIPVSRMDQVLEQALVRQPGRHRVGGAAARGQARPDRRGRRRLRRPLITLEPNDDEPPEPRSGGFLWAGGRHAHPADQPQHQSGRHRPRRRATSAASSTVGRTLAPSPAASGPATSRAGPLRRSQATPPSMPWPSTAMLATRSISPASAIPACSRCASCHAVPVVGMAEAACREAAAAGRVRHRHRGTAWEPMLREFVASLGLSDALAAIPTVAPTGGDIARDPDAASAILVARLPRLRMRPEPKR